MGNPKIVDRVKVDLAQQIEGSRKKLDKLLEELNKGNASLGECWKEFNRIKGDKVKPIFRECLALLQGSLVRKYGLDDGICRIADALVYDIEYRLSLSWGRFTILAEEEFINEMAMIIRIYFPDVSIWNLPVVAHEFGHFVGPELKVKTGYGYAHHHPIGELLDEGKVGEMSSLFLHEHFADHFATYVLGPCYAFSCVLLRFNPLNASMNHTYHPSDNKRVYWILELLKKMDEAEGSKEGYYSKIIERLKNSWEESLAAVGLPRRLLDDKTMEQLLIAMQDFEGAVGDKLSGVRYKGTDWLNAVRLSALLLQGIPRDPEFPCSLADVLNAAWLSRVHDDVYKDSARVQLIGQRAKDLCYKIGGISK